MCGKDGVGLEHHGDAAILGRQVVDHPVADAQFARGDVLEPGDHPEQGRFPAARGTDEDAELAVLDVDVDALDHLDLAETLGGVPEGYLCHVVLPSAFADGQAAVGQHLDRVGVGDLADEGRSVGLGGEAEDLQPLAGFDNARGVAAAGQRAVEEPAGGDPPGAARALADQVMGAGDRAAGDRRGLGARKMPRRGAEQAVPAALVLEHLRHLQLAVAAGEDRGFQRPVDEVGRGGEADGAGGVGLVDAGTAGGEVHQPAGAVGVAHHPGVAHRPVVPSVRAERLVAGIVRAVEALAVADPLPVVEIGRGGMADALHQTVFGPRRPCVEQVPLAVVAAQGRAGPGGVVVPGRAGGGGEAGAVMGPALQVGAAGMALGDMPVAQLGVAQRLWCLQEIGVPAAAVANVPAVPEPFVGDADHHQPLTPVEAIEAMNALCMIR